MTPSIMADHFYAEYHLCWVSLILKQCRLCWASLMLSVTYADCPICGLHAQCHYIECHYAECHGTLPGANTQAYLVHL